MNIQGDPREPRVCRFNMEEPRLGSSSWQIVVCLLQFFQMCELMKARDPGTVWHVVHTQSAFVSMCHTKERAATR